MCKTFCWIFIAYFILLKEGACIAVISTLGSICCFGLSNTIGKGIANAIWPTKVEAFGKEVDKRQNDMLLYIIFLRLTPILPNTFINVASPVVRVPFLPFVIGIMWSSNTSASIACHSKEARVALHVPMPLTLLRLHKQFQQLRMQARRLIILAFTAIEERQIEYE